jgi:hypothetical protein
MIGSGAAGLGLRVFGVLGMATPVKESLLVGAATSFRILHFYLYLGMSSVATYQGPSSFEIGLGIRSESSITGDQQYLLKSSTSSF